MTRFRFRAGESRLLHMVTPVEGPDPHDHEDDHSHAVGVDQRIRANNDRLDALRRVYQTSRASNPARWDKQWEDFSTSYGELCARYDQAYADRNDLTRRVDRLMANFERTIRAASTPTLPEARANGREFQRLGPTRWALRLAADAEPQFKFQGYSDFTTFEKSYTAYGAMSTNGFRISRDTVNPNLLVIQSATPFEFRIGDAPVRRSEDESPVPPRSREREVAEQPLTTPDFLDSTSGSLNLGIPRGQRFSVQRPGGVSTPIAEEGSNDLGGGVTAFAGGTMRVDAGSRFSAAGTYVITTPGGQRKEVLVAPIERIREVATDLVRGFIDLGAGNRTLLQYRDAVSVVLQQVEGYNDVMQSIPVGVRDAVYQRVRTVFSAAVNIRLTHEGNRLVVTHPRYPNVANHLDYGIRAAAYEVNTTPNNEAPDIQP